MTEYPATQDDQARRNTKLVQGDLVFTHSIVHGWAANPVAIVDIFGLKNGRVVEHWDVVPDLVAPEASAHGNAMV